MAKLILPVGERDHVQGPPTAPVTLVEYGDYECPYCGQAYPIVKLLQQRLGPELRFVFRNFPLRQSHPHAEAAAEAAEAAGAQARFWEMHDLLYENQTDLGHASLIRYARKVVPDLERWIDDVEHQAFARRIAGDFSSGVRSGVNGTPTFFIDGLRFDGAYDLETLEDALRSAVSARGASREFADR